MPPAVLLIAALMAVLIIRHWNRASRTAVSVEPTEVLAIREDVRKETEI
jgi:hypothetical protein